MKKTYLTGFTILFLFLALISCKKKEETDKDDLFSTVLILGNSITHHLPAPEIGWFGDWGMAASAADKDYVHILMKRFKNQNNSVNVHFRNIADFETGYWNYDYSKLDNFRDLGPDLLILRIGENVRETDMDSYDFGVYYLGLIDYFKQKNPALKIICVSSFWDQPGIEDCISKLSKDNHLPMVSIKELSADITNTAFGIFSHSGVASHPSDKGMKAIADMIWDEIRRIEEEMGSSRKH